MVFEGAFEKIFNIIKEEGGSEGGVVVQVIYCYSIWNGSLINFSSLFIDKLLVLQMASYCLGFYNLKLLFFMVF